ncbi:MAG: hypothetical protein JWN40_5606 [Phycisphaerales bacterium]|nr:hypothetical protein [Phycisphaerales bacterium]
MPDPSDTGHPRPTQERVNPSLESTRQDDARSREARERAGTAGTMAGVGMGCVGMALLPWVLIGLSVLAAIAVAMLVRWHYG